MTIAGIAQNDIRSDLTITASGCETPIH